MKGEIKAVLLDLDGTLIDTEPLSTEAINNVLYRLDPNVDPVSPHLKNEILGMKGLDWASIVLDKKGLRSLMEPCELIVQWEAECKQLYHKAQLLPGINELIQRLVDLNVPLAICTSSNSEAVSCKRTYHEPMFARMKTVVTGDDPLVKNGKPAPDIFLEGARRLEIAPENCLVFEDSPSGVIAGIDAGCHVCVLPGVGMPLEKYISHERLKVFKSAVEFDFHSYHWSSL
eukprot:Nk52_evm76s62 gene=Nk52_evmTU76s62